MNNNNQEHRKKMLQQTIARNIGAGILKLQNQWTSGMNYLFNPLPAKIKIATLLLLGILLTIWNIAQLSGNEFKTQIIPADQTKSAPISSTLASDSLLLMERIYEFNKKPQR